MKALLDISSWSDPRQGDLLHQHGLLEPRLLVLAGPHALSEAMLTLTARLARRGPLVVLDGGNRFNAYLVARQLRHLSGENQTGALSRIRVARAFTCHQVLALLESTSPQAIPTLVIDLLDTFYDESVDLVERSRLALKCTEHLRRLSQHSIVVVSVRPPRPPQTDPTGILGIIQDAADQFLFQDTPDSAHTLPLFAGIVSLDPAEAEARHRRGR